MEAKDIAVVIRACKAADVKSFKMNGIEIDFSQVEKEVEHTTEGFFIDNSTFPMYAKETDQVEPDLSPEDQKKLDELQKEEREELMLLEDPLEWERQAMAALDSKEA